MMGLRWVPLCIADELSLFQNPELLREFLGSGLASREAMNKHFSGLDLQLDHRGFTLAGASRVGGRGDRTMEIDGESGTSEQNDNIRKLARLLRRSD